MITSRGKCWKGGEVGKTCGISGNYCFGVVFRRQRHGLRVEDRRHLDKIGREC